MSLFHLFSKPKVERARGHRDRGLPSLPETTTSDHRSSVKHEPDSSVSIEASSTVRAPSTRSHIGSWTFGLRTNNTRPAAPVFDAPRPRERRLPHIDPPPLFQAYPQSIISGVLEIPTTLVEAPATKPKSRKLVSQRVPEVQEILPESNEDEARAPAKLGTKQDVKHSSRDISSKANLPKKIFVLITSGCILQYTDSGSSDRLPEKMLLLGKESAASVCDRVPGRRFALQVSEAVDGHGSSIPARSTLFSKLSIRQSATKRFATDFILVMNDAQMLDDWISAIKQQIETLGGQNMGAIREPSRSLTKSQSQPNVLKKTPSQSHRYQVKRDPSKISNVSSTPTTPKQETFALALPVPSVDDAKSEPSRPQSSSSEAATIDDIEAAASKLIDNQPDEASTSAPLPSPMLDDMSPILTAAVESNLAALTLHREQHRGSIHSLPVSDSSSPPATSSRLSAASPSIETEMSEVNDSPPTANTLPFKLQLPTKVANRRSSALRLSIEPQALARPGQSPSYQPMSPMDSPVVGRNARLSIFPSGPLSPRPLVGAISEPNLQLAAAKTRTEKRDSKMPPLPLQSSDDRRPESVVGELFPSSAWNSSKPSSRRTSAVLTTSASTSPPEPLSYLSSVSKQPQSILKIPTSPNQLSPPDAPRPASVVNSRRLSSFSMPLKINPSTSWNQHAPSINKRASTRLSDPDPPSESPQVYTLNAKVDPQQTRRFSVSPQPSPDASSNNSFAPPPRRSSAQLSLFPNVSQQVTPPVANPTEAAKAEAIAQARALRRPTSLQVRADHAPFLSSTRNAAVAATLRPGQLPAVPAAPIRGLRASRSASNVPSLASLQQPKMSSSPPEAFRALKFDMQPTVREGEELAMRDRVIDGSGVAVGNAWSSPSAVTTNARASIRVPPGPRKSKSGIQMRSSMSDLGFMPGPIVGFGPPAPPPSAPLPPPPSGPLPLPPTLAASSGPTTATATRVLLPSANVSMHPRQIMIDNSASASRMSTGLGIQVG